jgi:MoaA/NifB/PqqE/SkfB family radical SAM enzyme
MSSIKHNPIKRFKRFRKRKGVLCKAPFVSMSIGLDGKVSPCCYTQVDDYKENDAYLSKNSLSNIWHGISFNDYRKMMKKGRLPSSCKLCREKLEMNDFTSVKIMEYEKYIISKWPQLIEISVDNTCNLECVMCSSINSSKIAQKNNIKSKGDFDLKKFSDEIKPFLRNAKHLVFSGGEPFLSTHYYNMWAYLIKNNPECEITLNTNATVIPDKAKKLIEKARFYFNISIDSIAKQTYESIRLNANYEEVIRNFHYLKDYVERKGTDISVPVCPLTLNYRDIPELIEFCNKNGAYMVYVHVFGAYDVSLRYAETPVLKDAIIYYESLCLPETSDVEVHNAERFKAYKNDVIHWYQDALAFDNKIKSIVFDNNAYHDCLNELKIELQKTGNINADKVYNQLEGILNGMPEYVRNECFVRRIIRIPFDKRMNEIENMSEKELQNIIFALFRDSLRE